MSSSIIELDNSDEMLIYQQNLQHKKGLSSNQIKQMPNNTDVMNDKRNKGLVELPSKFVIRPLLLKYIDRIQQLYLEQKTPSQIQNILKEPTLIQIQCILKEKIHTFLNIIFQSSHCFTEEQAQKIRPQVDQKIERISLQMLDPFKNNFVEPQRYQSFLKLMKYHKEGRRSEKISKKCNTFFRLFFLKMKFEGISHTEGNIIQLNEPKANNRNGFQNQNDDSQQSGNSRQKSKNKKKSKGQQNDELYESKNSSKKYLYPKQSLVNQKMMDEAKQSLLKQIRSKIAGQYQQKQTLNKQSSNTQNKNNKRPQNSGNKPEIEIDEDEDTFQWTFDKQNTLLFILFDCHFKKLKTSKIIATINDTFSKKYDKVKKQPLDLNKLISKLQSMFSISCQKFIRRIKYLTIKEGLQNNPSQNPNENRKSSAPIKSSKKKRVYSIMDIEKSIEMQNDQRNLSKEDEFYFSKLKQHLKALQARQVYLSSSLNLPCHQEWTFMFEFIRQFYFSVLEEFKFDHLLQYAKRVIQMKTIEKNLSQIPVYVQDQDDNENNSQQDKKKTVECEKDLLQKLPKSSFSFTLSKMSKSKPQSSSKQFHTEENQTLNNKYNQLQFVSIDQILKKSYNHNENKKSIEQRQENKIQKNHIKKDKLKNTTVKIQDQHTCTQQNGKRLNQLTLKQKEFKRVHPIQIQEERIKQQNLTVNNRTAKRTGQPLKRIKQNQNIFKNYEKKMQKFPGKSIEQKIQYVSDDEFQQVFQLDSSGENQIEHESFRNQNPPSDKYQEQKQTQICKQTQQENQDILSSYRQLPKRTISVKPRGPRQNYEEDIRNEEIQSLIREIQDKQNYQQQLQDGQIKQPPELSIIQEEQQEDGSQNISISHDRVSVKPKNLLALEDQYSIYQIDFENNPQILQASTKIYSQSQAFSKQSTSYQKESIKNEVYGKSMEKKLSQNRKSDPSLSLEMIRKQLQKIKSMGQQQDPSQQKPYSTSKTYNKNSNT